MNTAQLFSTMLENLNGLRRSRLVIKKLLVQSDFTAEQLRVIKELKLLVIRFTNFDLYKIIQDIQSVVNLIQNVSF